MIFWFSTLFLYFGLYSAHVRLTYPKARRYDLDALNNQIVPGTCGMPRDLAHVTNIPVNTSFQVTWHVGSPHEGGFRIELLDKNYNLLHTLVPAQSNSSEFYGDNPVVRRHRVSLPEEFICQDCVLRLLKLAKILVPGSKPAYFFTCADVNIVNKDVKNDCSGHGQWTGKSCTCDKWYAGDVCQYQDECAQNDDCSSNGFCIATNATSYPKKQCFCTAGWFGSHCEKESPINSTTFDPKLYQQKSASGANVTLYWRILEDIGEIEIAVQATTDNWVAIGWRPSGLNTSCKTFPKIDPEIVETVGSDGKKIETSVDFFNKTSTFISDRLHPMACTDIAFVTARKNLSRIRDMYTRDHSTPREDSIYNGKDDLTAAVASEDSASGNITFLIRKKLIASEPADQSITTSFMHVIWAIGQKPFDSSGMMQNNLNMKNITNTERIHHFFRKGELNVHVHNATSRGFWEMKLR